MPQSAVDLMRSQFRMAHDWVTGTMQSVTPEQAHFRPGGRALPIGAHYAHIVTGEDIAVLARYAGRPPLLETTFAGKTGISTPPPNGPWDDWARAVRIDLPALHEYAAAVFAAIDDYLAGLTDADLAKPIDLSSWGMGEQPFSFVLNLFLGNAFAHCGEISCLKGLQGATGYPF